MNCANQHAHCSSCGRAFDADTTWPRRCLGCGNTTYRNPIPVAVIIQPVGDGVVVIRRNIEPQRGGLALPGGYVNHGEDWRVAAARELAEETGIRIADPTAVEPFAVESSPNGSMVLLFGLAPQIAPSDLPPFTPNDEAVERLIVNRPIALTFPLHTQALARYVQANTAKQLERSQQQPKRGKWHTKCKVGDLVLVHEPMLVDDPDGTGGYINEHDCSKSDQHWRARIVRTTRTYDLWKDHPILDGWCTWIIAAESGGTTHEYDEDYLELLDRRSS